jgi:hypothetical protein
VRVYCGDQSGTRVLAGRDRAPAPLAAPEHRIKRAASRWAIYSFRRFGVQTYATAD